MDSLPELVALLDRLETPEMKSTLATISEVAGTLPSEATLVRLASALENASDLPTGTMLEELLPYLRNMPEKETLEAMASKLEAVGGFMTALRPEKADVGS